MGESLFIWKKIRIFKGGRAGIDWAIKPETEMDWKFSNEMGDSLWIS